MRGWAVEWWVCRVLLAIRSEVAHVGLVECSEDGACRYSITQSAWRKLTVRCMGMGTPPGSGRGHRYPDLLFCPVPCCLRVLNTCAMLVLQPGHHLLGVLAIVSSFSARFASAPIGTRERARVCAGVASRIVVQIVLLP